MRRAQTPSFVYSRKIRTGGRDGEAYLEKLFNACERAYNNCVRHVRRALVEMREDAWYREALRNWRRAKKSGDDRAASLWANEISVCLAAYGLREYDLHAYIGTGKARSLDGCVGINILQKQATSLARAVRKAAFGGTDVRFRKKGETVSFEDKRADSGIIYRRKDDTVSICGRRFALKPARKKDWYLQEAMACRIKYCRIVREPDGTGCSYYLQAIAEGMPPAKIKKGTRSAGIDPGVSTMAVVSDRGARFEVLADGVEAYDREIGRWAAAYERRRRLANPGCYNEDGTIKKEAVFRVRTRGMGEALMRLRNAYRRKNAFVRQSHGRLTNRILDGCGSVCVEPMDYRALARRAKGRAVRSEKASVISDRKGRKRKVFVFKRRKRFGKSVLKRSPGLFLRLLKEKAERLGIFVLEVSSRKYRASQYDHTDGTYKKPALSDRTKRIGGHMVQRDLYSAFLLYCAESEEVPDRSMCEEHFRWFLRAQGKAVADVMRQGDTTGNFGLRDFKKPLRAAA